MSLPDRVRHTTATTGSGTITLGNAVVRSQSFTAAGVANGVSLPYSIDDIGDAWETGVGVFNSTSGTFTRTLRQSSTGSLLNLSGLAMITIAPGGADLALQADLSALASRTTVFSGDATGLGSNAITLTLSNTGVTAGAWTKVTVDVKGRITAGASLSSGDVTTALGFTPVDGSYVSNAVAAVVAQAFFNRFSGDGSTTVYTLDHSVAAAADITVTINGVIQTPTTDYNVSSTSLTFVTAPLNGAVILVRRSGGSTGASSGGSLGYTPLNKAGDTLSGSVNPATSNTVSLGSNAAVFAGVYATVFWGEATSSRYADLAERYAVDGVYAPGTVMIFGGDREITPATAKADIRLAGVLSTAPGLRMNDGAGDDLSHPHLAMVGRCPVLVTGTIRRGDLLTTSEVAGHACATDTPRLGSIIGKALQDFSGERGVIEASVMRS